jgi:hypothetical protein
MTGTQTLHIIHSNVVTGSSPWTVQNPYSACAFDSLLDLLRIDGRSRQDISGDDIRQGSLVRSTVNVRQVELWILYIGMWGRKGWINEIICAMGSDM